jgi:hypothetical protein
MAERGINTRLVTGRPHHPEGAVYPQARGRSAERRAINGVDVARLPIPRRLGSALRRMQTIAPERSALWRLQGESGAFVCVAPDDKNSLADEVAALADDAALRAELGARGRAYVFQHFSKQKSLDRLISALHGAA